MEADPLVSIIVPAYNGEPFIGDTLDSALAQTYRHIEVIIVDDGSRDRTRAIAEAHAAADPRVRVISQDNRGPAATRNRALEHASGDFVAPLDADDLWDPTKIERQVRRAQERGADTGLVYCWWVWIDANGAVLESSPPWRIEGNAIDALVQVNYIGNSSVPLFRRDYLKHVGGYDVSLRDGCEDWDVALKVAEQSRVAVVPLPLVGYRWHRSNRSGKTDSMWRSHRLVVTAARRRRPELDAMAIRRSEDQFALYLAGVSFWSNAYGQAIRWGLRRRSAVTLQILPHVIRLLMNRLLSGRRRARPTIQPGASFAGWDMPEPPIPYERIYNRRLRGKHGP